MSKTHLRIENISKSFGHVKALDSISLDIGQGSFVCLLGPSGCGKTTLLRIIAGFETATHGRLTLDGQDITGLAPHTRSFGMVFQSLALFPHMTVFQNIAYGLKLRKTGLREQTDRVDELLNLIELPNIADRPVSALSGGQRQRVAIARALAIRPRLFLLDEPLSALDAKLRETMQIELRKLQRKFGVTTILVTHDQTEAMMLADELVVMKDGRIRQAGPPTEVYNTPSDAFIADFLGSANLVPAEISEKGTLVFCGHDTGFKTDFRNGTKLTMAVRPESIQLATGSGALPTQSIAAKVEFSRDLGALTECLVSVNEQELRVRSPHGQSRNTAIGEMVTLKIDFAKCQLFPESTDQEY